MKAMKADRCTGKILFFFLFVLITFITLPALAYDTADLKRAEKFYQQGFTAFNSEHWSDAARNFRESLALVPHSRTAYMLSVIFLEMESPRDALIYAEKAVQLKPKLEEPYVTAAVRIIDWANKAKGDSYYIRGKADGPNRPASPKYPPPQPIIPQSRNLDTPQASNPVTGPSFNGTAMPSPAPVTSAVSLDLTGTWRCNDGGMYSIRQIGSELWWYGHSPDGGKQWSNVLHGRIHGNRISGQWADVPPGQARNSGELLLQIVEKNMLRAVRKSGGFGGSEWIR